MPKFYVTENNSGGFWVALCIEDNGGFFGYPHHVEIEAENADDAIRQFEEYYNLSWNHENSYEGNSCDCCGRRFTLVAPRGFGDSQLDEYGCVEEDDNPYFLDEGSLLDERYKTQGCKLEDAPRRLESDVQ